MLRDSPEYGTVTRLGYALTEAGFFVVTGGGPGAMEAGNLGAYLTRAEDPAAIEPALAVLAEAPSVEHAGYGAAAAPPYDGLLALTDDVDEALEFIRSR